MGWLKWILTSLFVIHPQWSLAIPFYRHPEAAFSSGQASLGDLEKTLVRIEFKPNYHVEWNKKKLQIKGDDILRDIQLANTLNTKKNALLRSEPKSNASFIKGLPENTKLEVLKTDAYWAEVYVPQLRLRGWIPLSQTSISHEDFGVFIPVIDTFLRSRAEQNSQIITTIPSGVRLKPIYYNKNWIQVSYKGQQGYIDTNHGLNRGNFAKWVFHRARKSWLPVSRYSNGEVVTLDQKKYSLPEFSAFNPDPDLAIFINALENEGPQKLSRAKIIQSDSDLWAISQVDGHGEVWWRKQTIFSENITEKESFISTADILKKKIFSIAMSNLDPHQGLISAEGIFATQDGQNWFQIKQFGTKDTPVAIHKNGDWFVGDYRSSNQGKSFEPYIRWDWVAMTIENATLKSPKYLKLSKIMPLDHSRVEIQVDTGYKKLTLQSHIKGTSLWKLTH